MWSRKREHKKQTLTELEYMIHITKETSRKEVHLLGVQKLSDWALLDTNRARSADSRILAKLVTGNDDPWEEELNVTQMNILKNLIDEVSKW